VGEVVEMVGGIIGRTLDVQTDAARVRPPASEVQLLLSDPARAKALCGWAPVTSLEEGLGRTVNWIERNQARFRVGEYVI
jgi:dTDP-glucose 4,6-dehydratase